MAQWSGLGALPAEGPGSTPGWGTKIASPAFLQPTCGPRALLSLPSSVATSQVP